MALAGELIIPPYHLVSIDEASTSTFTTTETVTDTITVTLSINKTYLVAHSAMWNSSVAADTVAVRMREDNLTGTALNGFDVNLSATSHYFNAYIRCYYTATSSGSKTFVITGQRVAGSGNVMRAANTTNPSIFNVDQVL
jgi:hypothetical protein